VPRGRADAEIGLAADDRLDRELLLREGGQLVVDAAVLCPLQRHDEGERLFRDHVAQRHADGGFLCAGERRTERQCRGN
jgi:hypothetical protein